MARSSEILTNKHGLLIKEVSSRRCIFDYKDPHYNDTDVLRLAWAGIAVSLNIKDGKTAKEEWKRICDNFRNAFKSHITAKRFAFQHGKPPDEVVSRYKYYSEMSFLIPFLYYRLTNKTGDDGLRPPAAEFNEAEVTQLVEDMLGFINDVSGDADDEDEDDDIEDYEDDDDDEDDEDNYEPVPRRSRPTSERTSPMCDPRESLDYANTSLDIFFKAMCENTKMLPRSLQVSVKRKVLKVVDDAENENSAILGTLTRVRP